MCYFCIFTNIVGTSTDAPARAINENVDAQSSGSNAEDETKMPMIYGAVAFVGVAIVVIAVSVYLGKKRKARDAAAAAAAAAAGGGGGSMYSMQQGIHGSMQNVGSDYNVAYY